MWGGGDYEQIAQRFAGIHDRLAAALAPAPATRWLDVATGTGEVALRAARAGATVTGLDLSEALLEQARAKAQRRGLAVEFVLGDAQSLPFPDAAFDVVSSCFGVIFAPDQDQTARELARVCRRGGRLGLTAWRPKPELKAIYERFQAEPPAGDADAWGREERVDELLGDAFELRIEVGEWRLDGQSPEEVYDWFTQVAPPVKAFLSTLGAARTAQFREAMLEYWRTAVVDGRVAERREYLLVLGTRR